MKRKAVLRALLVPAVAGSLVLATGWAVASNMGFKLNYGTVNAINKLLQGSGVGIGAVVDENAPPTLVVQLNLAQENLPPSNSNMGFKLLVISLPEEGLEVVDPKGNSYLLVWDGNSFGFVALGEPDSEE